MANLLWTECLNSNPNLTYVFQSANTAISAEWANWGFTLEKTSYALTYLVLKVRNDKASNDTHNYLLKG